MNRRFLPLLLATAVAVLLVAGTYAALVRIVHPKVHVTAYFTEAVGVYAGSDVRVLGVSIGQITKVHPEGGAVRVEMEYDPKYRVPADATAVAVPPSIVSDRYVQLTPVYTGGARLRSGAVIPLERTVTPVELDEIYRNVNDLSVALGPNGANRDGALSRLLKVGADNLAGQGEQVHRTVRDLSTAVQTLANGRQDLFGTVRNLQQFTAALASSDQQVRAFNADLASVSEQLAGERDELAAALHNLSLALGQVAAFVRDNKTGLEQNVAGLAEVTGVLVQQRAALARFLDDAPLALGNLNLAYNPSAGTLDVRDNPIGTGLGLDRVLCEVLGQNSAVLGALGLPRPACDSMSPTALAQLLTTIRSRLGTGPLPAVLAPGTPARRPSQTGSGGYGAGLGGATGQAGGLDKTLGGILGVIG